MKALLRFLIVAAAPVAAALFLNSCAYDPYAYGYSPGFTSGSVLVSTGSSNWGYDPYRYAYYDYRRRSYYDPWLRGYYPTGYRPPAVTGCPHPHGWRPGRGVCPPPRSVRDHGLGRNPNRLAMIQGSNYSWASHVRHNQISQPAHIRQNPSAWAHRVQRQPSVGYARPVTTTAHRGQAPSSIFGSGSSSGHRQGGSTNWNHGSRRQPQVQGTTSGGRRINTPTAPVSRAAATRTPTRTQARTVQQGHVSGYAPGTQAPAVSRTRSSPQVQAPAVSRAPSTRRVQSGQQGDGAPGAPQGGRRMRR